MYIIAKKTTDSIIRNSYWWVITYIPVESTKGINEIINQIDFFFLSRDLQWGHRMIFFPSSKCSPQKSVVDWENFLRKIIVFVNFWLHIGHFFMIQAPRFSIYNQLMCIIWLLIFYGNYNIFLINCQVLTAKLLYELNKTTL